MTRRCQGQRLSNVFQFSAEHLLLTRAVPIDSYSFASKLVSEQIGPSNLVDRSVRGKVDCLGNGCVDMFLKRGLHSNVPLGSDLMGGSEYTPRFNGHVVDIAYRTCFSNTFDQGVAIEAMLSCIAFE